MNLATLRVEGPDEALSELKECLGLVANVEWRAGEQRRDGSVRDSSGFNATIADTDTMAATTDLLRSFLARCTAAAVVFPWHGVEGEVDIGFSVGDSVRFFGGFALARTDVQACARCGLGLSATAYPTSDEANAT